MYSNPSNYNLLRSTNREEIAAYVASFYQEVKHAKYHGLDPNMIRKTIDDPEIVPLESVDLYTAPHFQQGRISNEYFIELEMVHLLAFRKRTQKKKRLICMWEMPVSGKPLTMLLKRRK